MTDIDNHDLFAAFDADAHKTEWLTENEYLYWRLLGATAYCHEAHLIVRKYCPGSDAHHEFGDGRSAYEELESVACGYGPGGESMEGNLTVLFSLDAKGKSMKDLITIHYDLYLRIMEMDVDVDTFLKHSLLRCVRDHADYTQYQSVEEAVAAKTIDYKTGHKMLMESVTRKAAHSSASAVAFYGLQEEAYAGDKRKGGNGKGGRGRNRNRDKPAPDPADIHCFKCGKPGVKSNHPHDCNIDGPHKKHAAFDREKAMRLTGRPKPGTTIPTMLAQQPSEMEQRLLALEAKANQALEQSRNDDTASQAGPRSKVC